jgi:hypothetical protein
MKHIGRFYLLIGFLVLALLACSSSGDAVDNSELTDIVEDAVDESELIDIVWETLEPNTSSHDLANWDAVDIREVKGNEVVEQFEDDPAPGCWQGPLPPENGTIDPSQTYWYVHMQPRPATPIPPKEGEYSPTAPPLSPEPHTRGATFLLDMDSLEIVARKLICVIY